MALKYRDRNGYRVIRVNRAKEEGEGEEKEYPQRRDRKSPIVIIISTIYPPLADKAPKSIHARVYTRRREGETRWGEAGTAGTVSREIQKVLDGAGRGLPVIIMTKARGKHPFNLLAYRQRRLRTTYYTPPTTPATDRL